MASGQITSRELTKGYLQRIDNLNPLLHAVIETNPQAVSIAAGLDNERRAGYVRTGPLHGIPVIVKDNIATDDTMQTTAGSLALLNNHVAADAPLVAQLRAAARSSSERRTCPSGRTGAVGTRSAAGARAAGSRFARTSSTTIRGARAPAPPCQWLQTCAPSRSGPRRTARSWRPRTRIRRSA